MIISFRLAAVRPDDSMTTRALLTAGTPWTTARAWLKQPRNVLVLLVLLGLAIRVSCILWGIPIQRYVGRYHADEGSAYRHAVGFPGNYSSNIYFDYGTTLPYLVAVLVLPLKSFVTSSTYELICWMGLRIVSVLTGTGGIAIVYLLGKRLYDARTGLLAAALLAFSFSHCMNSSYANFDVPISFLALLCFMLVLRALDRDRVRDFIYLGVAAGILIGTKLTMIIVLAIPLVAVLIARTSRREEPTRTFQAEVGRGAICVAIALAIFVISNFHVVRNFAAFVAHWKQQKYLWYDRSTVPLTQVPGIWWRYTIAAMGAPTVVLALIGVFRLGRRDVALKVAMVVFLVAHFVLLRHHFYSRSAVEIAPLACLLAARACTSFMDYRIAKPVAYAAAAFAVMVSLTMSCRGVIARLDDPRTKAARFLAKELPAGSTIGIVSIYRSPIVASWQWPALDLTRLRQIDFLQMPEYLIDTSTNKDIMISALRSEKLGTNDIWDPAFNRDWYNYEPPPPRVFQFYRDLLNGTGSYTLIKSFEPRNADLTIEFGNVGIRVYKRSSAG